MRTEKEIRELRDKIEESIRELEAGGFAVLTNKGEHWLDCLDWVLEDEK